MARKKQKKMKFPSLFGGLSEETRHGVWAVLFFVLAIFFALASFGIAGVVGNTVYAFFKTLLGVGYFLLPLVLGMIAVTYTGSLREQLGGLRVFGAMLFFVSALALIDLIFDAGGGLVGQYISTPLYSLFDKVTGVFLFALVLISSMIMFDFRPSMDPLKNFFGKFRRKKEFEEEYFDDYEDQEIYEDDEEYEDEPLESDEEEFEEEDEPEEPKKKKTAFKIFSGSKDDSDDSEFRFVPTLVKYNPPPLSLLSKDKGKANVGDVKANANIIKRTFSNFGIDVEMDEVSIGPTVTRYALKPAEGVRLQRILALQNNLELTLAAHPVRIEAPIPGKALVGIEVPNSAIATIGMKGILGDKQFKNAEKPLTVGLGKDIEGKVHFADLAKMPHCLIAGTTGSGKSVMIHSLVTSLLYKNGPEQLKLIMIDPKRVELTTYKDIPHLLSPVITKAKKAILALQWAGKEMERRYEILEECGVRNLESYHANVLAPAIDDAKDMDEEERMGLPESLPYIVIVIDELADIMTEYPKELEAGIVRLAAKSRAVGIHLVLSTQRPSVNVVTGLIKANVPTRFALQVASQIDSRTILDMAGAEKLLGKGDMLYLSNDSPKPIRVQSPFISEEEVKKVVKHLIKNHANDVPHTVDFTADNAPDVMFSGSLDGDSKEDDLYEDARRAVIEAGKASTSYLQRKLGIGYARAARLMDSLEERGVIGPANGSKPREILNDEEEMNDDGDEYEEEGDDEEYEDDGDEDEEEDVDDEEYEEDEEGEEDDRR